MYVCIPNRGSLSCSARGEQVEAAGTVYICVSAMCSWLCVDVYFWCMCVLTGNASSALVLVMPGNEAAAALPQAADSVAPNTECN